MADSVLQVLARSDDGVFAVDAEQRITFCSLAAAELLGVEQEDLVGKRCYEVILGTDYEGHPFCRPDCPSVAAARRGQGVPNYDLAYQRNGDEIWLNVSIVPMPRSANGEATAIHMVRDVSRRRQCERLAQAAIETAKEFMGETGEAKVEAKLSPAPTPALTAREMVVLRLLADGRGTTAMATELGLSEATIRNHIQRLLAKLGVHSRLEAVVYGARHGLI